MIMSIAGRWFAVLLMVSLLGGTRVAAAQEEGEGQDGVDPSNFEFGVGLYLTNCESLVEGTALFDLGDAELETNDFSNSDENEAADGEGEDEEGTDIEGEVDTEEQGDETNVEGAIGSGEGEQADADRQIVVQEGAPLVWIAGSEDSAFQADLAELVTAPFAVAVRQSTQDEAATEGEDAEGEDAEGDFIACGEFGGAIAGNQIIIPLQSIMESEFSGIAILTQQGEQEVTASVYLFGGAAQSDAEIDVEGGSDGEATPTT